MTTSEVLPRMIEFVKARLDELEHDAPLLSEGKHTGVITETWVRDHVDACRTIVRLYEDNVRVTSPEAHRAAQSSLKWAVFAMADGFKHHPDYDPKLWSE